MTRINRIRVSIVWTAYFLKGVTNTHILLLCRCCKHRGVRRAFDGVDSVVELCHSYLKL
ncbi:hypothetical protein Dtox_1844 [Desulfofarcimen acetoxidans DSM 771]|uniref:Uncharacterized protein n=1 Tax=Desulfofarcimen acetoxidans (strain ATCC 49208 / DSM 771 / KCTC 5769 / VKM B-1644 / 5575) TaxID=485916 RepID=C8VXN6_DESAS|nr:hypothetical protein Dtox_1844 [Desulfofarcimen acetoxidans DSM 771]